MTTMTPLEKELGKATYKRLKEIFKNPNGEDEESFPELARICQTVEPDKWRSDPTSALIRVIGEAIQDLPNENPQGCTVSWRYVGTTLCGLRNIRTLPPPSNGLYHTRQDFYDSLYEESGFIGDRNAFKKKVSQPFRKRLARILLDKEKKAQRIAESEPIAQDELVRSASNAEESSIPLHEAKNRTLPDGAPWPFKFIEPKATRNPEWHDLLGGSDLAPDLAPHGGIVERRILLGSQEMDSSEALSWLAAQRGRTVLLYGDRGDGKSSYINSLAASSLDTHIFLRWTRPDLGLDIEALEDYCSRISTLTGHSPVVVVVCTLPLYGNSEIEQRLAQTLRARELDRDEIVILVDGRPGDLDRLARYKRMERIDLAPVNQDEARKVRELLLRAHHELRSNGTREALISDKYPNLPTFLQLDAQSQEDVLAGRDDPSSPMLVRLLRAVYGDDMWLMLYQELVDLEAADRKAYLHVCLASMAGVGLPESMLRSMAPGTNLDARSNRDPWLRDDGQHWARHQFIAQVVLEKSWKNWATLIDECVGDYTNRIRSDRQFSDILRQILLAMKGTSPASKPGDHNNLRSTLLRVVRERLTEVENFETAIASQAPDDYWHFFAWSRVIWDLVPDKPRSEEHLRWLDINDRLLEMAQQAPNCPGQELVEYYRTRSWMQRQRLCAEIDFDTLTGAVNRIAPYAGSEWCTAGFYLDMFWWAQEALSMIGAEELQGDAATQGRHLYRKMSQAYEKLRGHFPEIDLTGASGGRAKFISYGDLISKYLYRQLPFPHDILSILGDCWRYSVDFGNPNGRTGALYAEELLSRMAKGPSGTSKEALRAEAIEVLRTIITSEESVTPHPHAAYMLAVNAKRDDVSSLGLAERIDVTLDDAELSVFSRACLMHARGLIESHKDRCVDFLRAAISGYAQEASRSPHTIGLADNWKRACRDLKEAGGSDWQAYDRECRKFYQRYYGRIGR